MLILRRRVSLLVDSVMGATVALRVGRCRPHPNANNVLIVGHHRFFVMHRRWVRLGKDKVGKSDAITASVIADVLIGVVQHGALSPVIIAGASGGQLNAFAHNPAHKSRCFGVNQIFVFFNPIFINGIAKDKTIGQERIAFKARARRQWFHVAYYTAALMLEMVSTLWSTGTATNQQEVGVALV